MRNAQLQVEWLKPPHYYEKLLLTWYAWQNRWKLLTSWSMVVVIWNTETDRFAFKHRLLTLMSDYWQWKNETLMSFYCILFAWCHTSPFIPYNHECMCFSYSVYWTYLTYDELFTYISHMVSCLHISHIWWAIYIYLTYGELFTYISHKVSCLL